MFLEIIYMCQTVKIPFFRKLQKMVIISISDTSGVLFCYNHLRQINIFQLVNRSVYKISNVGTVAGCRVTSGKITRDSKVRVVRDGIVITEDEIASLKRFKDDAKEVAEGYECGVTLAKFADVKEGDVYEAFKMEEYRD